MNTALLASIFTEWQTILLIVISVALFVFIVLNIVLAVVLNKRGERKMYDRLLQQQRELLMQQLQDMKKGEPPKDKRGNIITSRIRF